MPIEKEKYNAYMRKYMLNRYIKRMASAISQMGGKCIECGSTENLEFHHRDRKDKTFSVGGSAWNTTVERFNQEVAKCDLLCDECHKRKHSAKNTHGTLSAYRYCHCDICKDAKRKYTVEYRKTHPRKTRARSKEA